MGKIATLIMFAVLYFPIKNYIDELSKIRQFENRISEVTNIDWSNGLPLDDLTDAHNICIDNLNLNGCSEVDEQIRDISISYQSCVVDRRSDLCRSLVNAVGKHQIYLFLLNVDPVRLPQSPFYFSMPTRALDSISEHFLYRSEVYKWWWQEQSYIVDFGLVLIAVTTLIGLMVHIFLVLNQRKVLENSRNIEIEKVEANLRITKDRIASEEKNRQERILLAAKISNEKQLSQNAKEEKKSAQSLVKMADDLAEKAEITELLRTTFTNGTTKK